MGKINIVNDSDGHLTVELDGKALSPQEIFNSSDSNTNITDDTGLWDLQRLGEQYDLTLEDIMAAVENYADTKNADIDYSVDELPSSVEPEAGAMSTFYENNKGTTKMNITKGRLKQIIQEELSREATSEGVLDNIKQKFKQPQVSSVPEFNIHWEAELAEAIGKALIKAMVEDDVLAVNDTLKSFAENAMRAGADSGETKAAIEKVITNAAEHLQLAATDETSPLQNWDDLHKEAGPTEM